MYTASNISVTVRDKIILRDVSLALHPGKFTAVLGPNGAGKSTLLKVMSNEWTSFHGAVSINGKNIEQYKPKELSLVRAVLPQSATLQFAFTVEQVVMLGRYAHATNTDENERIVKEVMALTNIASLKNRNYLHLSGGEKQRVQLARVLVQVWDETVYPRYILLDEPTSSLDIAQQQHILRLAKRVCNRNIGVLAIVHDLNQAIQYADEIHFIRDGKVIAAGDAQRVFTKPNIEETFNCRVNLFHDPHTNCPYIIPERDKDFDNFNTINIGG
jgi:iron complex transport system ATP-binding protein